MDAEAYLKKSGLFFGLNSFQIVRLARIAICQKIKKNTLIFSEGDKAAGFYIVLEGRIKIYKLSAEGKEYILHIAIAGDTIAEATIFSGKDYPAYAEAITSAQVLFFPKIEFLSLSKEYPEVGMRILQAVADRQRRFADIIEDLSLRSVLSRLAKYILILCREKGSNTFELDLKKSDLAMKLGTIPETLSRNFKKLKSKKIIFLKEKIVTILNKESLRKIANG